MRVLLDECLPNRLRDFIPGHEVLTVRQMHWLGAKNGRLLRLIGDAKFEVFVTMDRNLPTQQDIVSLSFCVVVLRAKSNRLEDTSPLMSELLRKLPATKPGTCIQVGPLADKM